MKCSYCNLGIKEEKGKPHRLWVSKYIKIIDNDDGTMEIRFVCKKCNKHYKIVEAI